MPGHCWMMAIKERFLSPRELKMNMYQHEEKKNLCKIMKSWEPCGWCNSFFLFFTTIEKILIFTSLSHYSMFLLEHVTKNIQSSPVFCRWLEWEADLWLLLLPSKLPAPGESQHSLASFPIIVFKHTYLAIQTNSYRCFKLAKNITEKP